MKFPLTAVGDGSRQEATFCVSWIRWTWTVSWQDERMNCFTCPVFSRTLSIATTQLPQQPAAVFIRADVGSEREAAGHFHPRSELLATRLTRGCFVIASCRLTCRTTTQRHCGHHAFEHNGVAGKRYDIAGIDPVRRLHTFAIEVNPAATDGSGGGGTGLEQSHSEQPAVDPRGARPCFFRLTHGPQSVMPESGRSPPAGSGRQEKDTKQRHPIEPLAKYDEAIKYVPNWKQLKASREAAAKQKT